jgi:hypothetical protein
LPGDVDGAAEMVKNTIKKSIPLILRFLAGLFGLSGFRRVDPQGGAVGESTRSRRRSGRCWTFWWRRRRRPGTKPRTSVMKKVDAIKEWWTKPAEFHYGDEPHTLEVAEEGDQAGGVCQQRPVAAEGVSGQP